MVVAVLFFPLIKADRCASSWMRGCWGRDTPFFSHLTLSHPSNLSLFGRRRRFHLISPVNEEDREGERERKREREREREFFHHEAK